MAQQATDSFVTEIGGAPVFVTKGEILPEGHPVLKALGDTHLFRSLMEDTPEPEPAKASTRTAKGTGSG
jgi:hypothetical protein